MININTYERQHADILDIAADLRKRIEGDIANIEEIATQINMLAGKVKIHINTEDRYLYPEIVKHNDTELEQLTSTFFKERDVTLTAFEDFKLQFNTKSKISGDLSLFRNKCGEIINILEDRIKVENLYLYPRIKGL